jgi:hypothetical protein
MSEIISHTHDIERGVYRVWMGNPVRESVPVTGPDGPLLDADGQIVQRDQVVGYENAFEYIFADDDPQWKDLSSAEIADLHARQIREARGEA